MVSELGISPENAAQNMYAESTTNKGYAVFVETSSGRQFLTAEFNWTTLANEVVVDGTLEAAQRRYLSLIEHVKNNHVVPLYIDNVRRRAAFRCPVCNLIHKTEFIFDDWKSIPQFVRRHCPKSPPDKRILIKVWKEIKLKLPTAPIKDINPCPNYDCKECFGSGEYVGFTSIQACVRCFPIRK